MNNYNQNILQEIFSLPIGLSLVAKFNGQKIYSSNKLKNKFLKAMLKQKIFKNSKKIIELINKNYILPCYLTKGLMGFTFYKIFGSQSEKSICGFFSPDSKRIYLMMANLGIFSSDKNLALLTLHEGMHKLFDQNPSSFKSIFFKDAVEFYKNYILAVYKPWIKNEKNLNSFATTMTTLTYNFEVKTKKVINASIVKKHIEEMKNLFNKHINNTDKKVNILLKNQEIMMTQYLFQQNLFFKNIIYFIPLMKGMIEAYKKTFHATETDTLPVQEMFFISEVIAIASSLDKSPKYSKGFEQIKVK